MALVGFHLRFRKRSSQPESRRLYLKRVWRERLYQLRRDILGWGIVVARFDVDPVTGVGDLYCEADANGYLRNPLLTGL